MIKFKVNVLLLYHSLVGFLSELFVMRRKIFDNIVTKYAEKIILYSYNCKRMQLHRITADQLPRFFFEQNGKHSIVISNNSREKHKGNHDRSMR